MTDQIDAARELINRIVDAPDLLDAAVAVGEALAACGVPSADSSFGDATTVTVTRPGVEPLAGWYLTELGALQIALEGRDRAGLGHLSLQDLANMFADLGVLTGDAESTSSDVNLGLMLRQFLANWHAEAIAAPEDETGAPVLLLAELAARQSDPIDIAVTDYDPNALWLGLLDWEVLLAGLARLVAPAPAGPGAEPEAGPGMPTTAGPAVAGNPCDNLVAWMSSPTPAGYTVKLVGKQAFSATLGSIASMTGLSGALKTAKAVKAALKLVKYIELFTSVTFTLEADPGGPYNRPGPEQDALLVAVKATVRIAADSDWTEFLRRHGLDRDMTTLRNCLTLWGLPAPPDPELLDRDMDGWMIEWELLGDPELALMAKRSDGVNEFDPEGSFRLHVDKGAAPKEAISTLWVDVLPEADITGFLVTGHVTVRAQLIANGKPSASDAAELANTGIMQIIAQRLSPMSWVSSGATTITGWLMQTFPPTRRLRLQIRYHINNPQFTGSITVRTTSKFTYKIDSTEPQQQESQQSTSTDELTLQIGGPTADTGEPNTWSFPVSGHQQLVSNEMRTFDKRDFSQHEHSQTNSSGSWTYQVKGGATIRLENDGRNYIGFQANFDIEAAEPITGGGGRSVTSGGTWQNQSGQQLADFSSDDPLGAPVGLDADSIAQAIAPVPEAPTCTRRVRRPASTV